MKLFYFVMIVVKEQICEKIKFFFVKVQALCDCRPCHDGYRSSLELAQNLQFELAKFS
jgi:hypothetical protein